MLDDDIKNSWYYKEIFQKGFDIGIQKGLEQGTYEQGVMKALRRVLIRIVEIRFSELLSLVHEEVERNTVSAVLDAKIDKILLAKTSEEAHQALQEIE